MLTAEELLATPNALAITEVVELEGRGAVRIRAFSKADHTRMIRAATDSTTREIDPERLEALALHYGLAEPELTVEQAEALRQKSWGPVQALLSRVWALSGMTSFGSVSEGAVAEAEGAFRE
jgi:hypothetical protein